MTSITTKSDSLQPATEMAVDLFDNWFDPIETEVRARAREFIEELIRGELDVVLARPRYGRSQIAGNEGRAGVAGHRHGSRTRSLRVWKRSPADDQDAFLIWAKPSAAKIGPITVGPIADPRLCLSKEVRDFLACWIFYKGSKAGRVMQELGFSVSDTSLSAAIKHGGPFRQEVIDKLEPWLTRNGFVPAMPGLGR
jgi:hypothetical protein